MSKMVPARCSRLRPAGVCRGFCRCCGLRLCHVRIRRMSSHLPGKNGEFLTQIRVGGEFLTQVQIAAAHGCSSCLQQIVRLQEIVLRTTGTMLQLMEYLPFAMSCSTTGKESYMYYSTTTLHATTCTRTTCIRIVLQLVSPQNSAAA